MFNIRVKGFLFWDKYLSYVCRSKEWLPEHACLVDFINDPGCLGDPDLYVRPPKKVQETPL
jgi:hypothetical protein